MEELDLEDEVYRVKTISKEAQLAGGNAGNKLFRCRKHQNKDIRSREKQRRCGRRQK